MKTVITTAIEFAVLVVLVWTGLWSIIYYEDKISRWHEERQHYMEVDKDMRAKLEKFRLEQQARDDL